jgi:hypothetical protein
MYQKACEGCGTTFEALKPSRKYCSDTCGKRTRRRTWKPVAPAIAGHNPDISPDIPDAALVREQLDFARAVNPNVSLSLDVVEALLADEYDHGVATSEDFDVVQRVLVSRAVAALEGLPAASAESWLAASDDVVAELGLVTKFLSDLVSPRIVAALAAATKSS